MSEEINLDLTEDCRCIDEDGDANDYCRYCNGTGEVLTDNGRAMIKFLRNFMFTNIN
jgi:hypothetical protein